MSGRRDLAGMAAGVAVVARSRRRQEGGDEMSDLVKSGVTKAMVEDSLRLLSAFNLAGLVETADEIGIGWYLSNASWEESHVESLGSLQCAAVVLRWYGEGDPSDEDGHHFWEAGITDPTEALRAAMRQALESIVRWWDDEEAQAEVIADLMAVSSNPAAVE